MYVQKFSSIQLLGDKSEFTFEHQMLNSSLLLVIFGSPFLLGIEANSGNFDLFIYPITFLFVTAVFAYRASRIRKKFFTALYLFSLIVIILLFITWAFLGGIKGFLPIVSFPLLILLIQFFPKVYFKYIIGSSLLLFFIFFYLEHEHHDLILIKDLSLKDIIIRWIFALTIAFYSLYISKKQYHKWKNAFYEKEVQLKTTLRKEQEINQLKGKFIMMVAHQFRTPMTTIQSSAELLELKNRIRHKDDPNDEIQYNRIYGAIADLTEMIEQITYIENIEKEKLSLTLKPTNLLVLLEELLQQTTWKKATSHHHAITTIGAIQNLALDEKLIKKSLEILISNAIKFDPKHRLPFIQVEYKTHHVEIFIRDRGIGIPETEFEFLFTPFFRASNANNIKGTGLGLLTVKHFIEIHQGSISVKSKENQGTEVCLCLPY
ncbi:sensor histidine kinase [Sediminitomix flava]|uniref:histidine kinase n=1 Tax=Sediminitomix flava TaxID=379075 RepID=A0A315ZF74_SEDFL|nr:HAMP domain-containing sensor histidine kinase [Sediminitomix flava]PWJ44205.1 phospho-acceptor domain-containing protein [Sediminitomix flava]